MVESYDQGVRAILLELGPKRLQNLIEETQVTGANSCSEKNESQTARLTDLSRHDLLSTITHTYEQVD